MTPWVHDYDFAEVFTGDFGETGFTTKAGTLKAFKEPFMVEAVALEEAKRKAAILTSQLAEPDETARATAVQSEKHVVKCRLDLIRKLMEEEGQEEEDGHYTDICNEVQDKPVEQVSVQYRLLHLRPNGLVPVQSQVAWPAELMWRRMHTLAAAPHEDRIPLNLNGLLNRMVSACLLAASKDESTRKLRDLYRLRGLSRRMQFQRTHVEGSGLTARWQQTETRHRTMLEYYAVPDQANETHPSTVIVAVLFGVLDINHCEQWQNPLINMYAKKAVIHAGEEAIRQMHEYHTGGEASRHRIKAPEHMHNFLRPVILIHDHPNVHVLTLAPYKGADTCTVQHVLIEDGRSGIVGLKDMTLAEVRGPGESRCTGLQYYHCVGSRPHARFNETELNYLHVQGLTSSIYDDDDSKSQTAPSADQAPPSEDREDQDDQSSSKSQEEGHEEVEARLTLRKQPRRTFLGVEGGDGKQEDPPHHAVFPASDSGDAKSARISFPDWDVLITSCKWTNDADPTTCITMINYPPQGMRYAKERLHGGASEFHSRHKQIYERDLDPNRAFYVKWFAREMHNHIPSVVEWNINLVNMSDNKELTHAMTTHMQLVKQEIQVALSDSDGQGTSIWIDAPHLKHKFTHNIKYNLGVTRSATALDIYRDAWQRFFAPLIANHRQPDGSFSLPGDCYLWADPVDKKMVTADGYKMYNVWQDILSHDAHLANSWQGYVMNRHWHDSGADAFRTYKLSAALQSTGGQGRPGKGPLYVASADRLPIAPRQPPSELLERIKSLEAAKLEDARKAQNREHLLCQVLARLSPGTT